VKTLLLHLMAFSPGSHGIRRPRCTRRYKRGQIGDLTIPWDEFKGLLNLDKDQIVIPLETFQKLLLQTGAPVPPHNVQGGMIIMTQDEFRIL